MSCPTLVSDTTLTHDDVSTTQVADEAAGEAAGSDGNNSDKENDQVPGKTRSRVWVHFIKQPDSNGVKMAKCRYCPKQYLINNGGTRNLSRHIENVHPEHDRGHELVDLTAGVSESSHTPPYSHATFREGLVRLIITGDLPFRLVDSPALRWLFRHLNPRVKVPSANTIRSDIDQHFKKEKARVCGVLRNVPGRLSFTVDAWVSPNAHAFLGITVHWVDAEWQLRHMLLDIPAIDGPHDGGNLCRTFVEACHGFRVMSKLLAVTSDNASNNDTFLANLEMVCEPQSIPFSRRSVHVRCAAHVINLAVQDFLGAFNSTALDSEDACAEDYTADSTAVSFISRLRKLVLKVRASVQRSDRLAIECTNAGVSPKKLILDVRTRWNSTHAMIERALKLREPLDAVIKAYPDLTNYRLTDREWQLLERVLPLLAAFETATDYLCTDAHPTLNTAVLAYDFLLKELDDYCNSCEGGEAPGTIKAATKAAIKKLKRYYTMTGAEVYAVATVLDPRLKLQYYRNHGWEEERIEEALEKFRSAYARYRSPPVPSANERAPAKPSSAYRVEGMAFKQRRICQSDELEAYVAAPTAGDDTKALQWWKEHAITYPCLAAMARDYLAIPATGAPVERVFSGGTTLVQPKRRLLREGSVRACMCLKDWLKLAR
jgi:hypothetical protein